MKEKDKIYELFRQNEHKLAEKPSRRAWERVDARLDRHYASGGQNSAWLRYGGMVAAVMILVLTASLLVMNNNIGTNDSQVAFNDMEEKTAPQLLDFKENGNIDNHLRIVAYQNEYKNRENRISENSIAGDLRPRGAKRTKRVVVEADNDEFDDAMAMNDIVAKENPIDKQEIERIDSKILNENIKIEEVAQNMMVVTEPALMDMELAKDKTFEKEDAVIEEIAAAAEDMPGKKASAKPTRATVVMPTSPSKGNADYATNIVPEPMPAVAEKEMDSSAGGVQFGINEEDEKFMGMDDEEAESLSLSDFNWLLGTWKGKQNGSISRETWTKMSTTSYKGRGTLIGGGTTLFVEKMELRITDIGTYLTISLDKKNKRVAYRMTSNNGYTIVFVNNSVDYPKKIILTKRSDDTLSWVMQAGDTESLDNEQVNYLENRNVIEGSKMVRSLRKDD